MNEIEINGIKLSYLSKINLKVLFDKSWIEPPKLNEDNIIYCIHNDINGKCYIGLTKWLWDRFIGHWWSHRETLIKYIENNSTEVPLYNALKKYGVENFTLYIIDEVDTPQELGSKERYWIQKLHTWKYDPECHGYNVNKGGEDATNLHTEEMWKRREIAGDGDVMYMCHTKEALEKSYETKIKRYGSISAFLSSPEAISKRLKTMSDRYDGDCAGQLHTKEVSIKVINTTLIKYITDYLDYLKSDGAPSPITWNIYWNWSDSYFTSSSHVYRHVRRVLSHLNDLRLDERWTEEMEDIFGYIEKHREEYNI